MQIFWRTVSQSLIGLGLMIFAVGAMAQDLPSEHQARVSELAATAAAQKSTDANGYTHWRSEINSGCSFSDHNYTIDIDVEPDQMSDISYTMSNYDVDYNDPQSCSGGPEVDRMYFNNHSFGILTGANNSWSVNTFPLTDSQVVKGSNQIHIDTDAPGTGCWCVGVGYIEVMAKVGFDVISHTPAVNEKNRNFSKPELTVSFSDDYNPATLTDSTFKLEYRNTAGAWQQVTGGFQQSGPESFKFVPSNDLKDGVKYRATVKSGTNGVKSLAGAEIQSDEQWSFWTVPDLKDSFNGAACAPSADPCPRLEVAVFQVSRNEALVLGKNAVARIFPRWKKHSDVHDDDQVKEMEVDFKLTGGGITKSQRAKVKRPDLYSTANKKDAKESVNIYHKPTSNAEYTVTARPTPQSNASPVIYDSNKLRLGKTSSALAFTLKYYFLKDGNWAAGAPAAAVTDGTKVMTDGAQFIGDTFPVLSSTPSGQGNLSVGYTKASPVNKINEGICVNVDEVNCPNGAGGTFTTSERQCVLRKLNQIRGTDPFVAAVVPSTLCPQSNGTRSGDAFIFYQGGGGSYGTVAHELGHVYTLGHEDSNTGIEGFQVRIKRNRSVTVDNTIASLMHKYGQPAARRWIKNNQYVTLQTSVAGGVIAATSSSAALSTLAATRSLNTGYLIVDGYLDLDAGAGELGAAFLQERPWDVEDPAGTCQVQLLDATGSVLSSFRFDPQVIEDEYSGPVGASAPTGPQLFNASIPWDDTATELKLSCNQTTLATRTRTAAAPDVDFVGLTDGQVLSGAVDIQWQGSDTDGPSIAYQLQLSTDDGATWSNLTPISESNHFELDTTVIPSTSSALLSVMVTDGFNTDYATVRVSFQNSFEVQATSPFDGESDVDVNAPIAVYFVSALDEATLTSSSFRVSAGGQPVPGTLSYDSVGKMASFVPSTPFAHSTVYQVQLTSALHDESGNPLALTSWTFTTAADTGPVTVMAVFPTQGAVDVPLNAQVQIELSEPAATGTLDTSSLLLLDNQGVQIPGRVSPFVDNTGAIFIADQNLVANMEYTVVVTTDVTDVAGNPLESDFYSAFMTGDRTFNVLRIVGDYRNTPSDDDSDGLYDKLTISVLVEVAQAGSFNLNGRLLTSDHDLIQWATSGNQYLDVGIHWVDLVLDGVPIRNTGMNGPYILDSLNFYMESNPSVGDVVFDAFRTYPYNVTLFYSVMTLGPLPDQLLEINTTKDNAINLRDYTTHATLPIDDISYSLLVGAVPEAGVSIDEDGNIDIVPQPGIESESDVTVQAKDTLGKRVQSTFHVSVQAPPPCGPGRALPANTWLMTAPSCQPSPADLASQYSDDLGGSYNTDWLSFGWNAAPTAQNYVKQAGTDALVPGTGNWLYSYKAGNLLLEGTATTTVPCSDYGSGLMGNCFAIDLTPSSGSNLWQIIGHPFPYTVSWADVRVAAASDCASWIQYTPSQAATANLMTKEYWFWNGSSYQTKDDSTPGSIGVLQPQESIWVRIKSGSSSLSADHFKLLIRNQQF